MANKLRSLLGSSRVVVGDKVAYVLAPKLARRVVYKISCSTSSLISSVIISFKSL